MAGILAAVGFAAAVVCVVFVCIGLGWMVSQVLDRVGGL